MPTDVAWSPAAIADLDAIWEWIAIEHEEPAAADRVVESIVDRVDTVSTFPLASTSLNSVCRIRSDWRFVEQQGYLVFFRVGAATST